MPNVCFEKWRLRALYDGRHVRSSSFSEKEKCFGEYNISTSLKEKEWLATNYNDPFQQNNLRTMRIQFDSISGENIAFMGTYHFI